MKKFILYSLFFVTIIIFSCYGKKEKNASTLPSAPESLSRPHAASQLQISSSIPSSQESKTEIEPESVPIRETIPDTAGETKSSADTSARTAPLPTDTDPESDASDNLSADNVSGIQINKDGSITVGKDTITAILEEEKEFVDALNLSDEEMESITSCESFTITPQLQKKMLEYLDTLPLTEKLRLLGRVTELLNN